MQTRIDPRASDEPRLTVEDAIVSRRSVRAFLPTPVPREALEQLFELAALAPSGRRIFS